jgi:adenylosuccinate synthase
MPGWKESTVGLRAVEALPANARRYLERIAALAEVPLELISTGPNRDQTIALRDPFTD